MGRNICDEAKGLPGVDLVCLGKTGRWDIFRFIISLIKTLRKIRTQILNGHLGVANLLTVLLKPFLPDTRMVWGIRASNMDLKRYEWLARLSFVAERFAARFADPIIISSVDGRHYHVAHGFPDHKITVIPNGIDTDRFRPDREAGRSLRSAWLPEGNTMVIGTVGRLGPMKDYETLLRAASLLLLLERKDHSKGGGNPVW